MADLADTPSIVVELSAALQAANIPHAISGAVAMAIHGFVRATRDIDILVSVPAIRLCQVFEIVRQRGFEGEDVELIAALRQRYVAELRGGALSVEILVPVLPYHRRVLERAVHLQVTGVDLPVVSPEDLVILKVLWSRQKDRADIRALAAATGTRLDRDYVRKTLQELLPADDPRHADLEYLWSPP